MSIYLDYKQQVRSEKCCLSPKVRSEKCCFGTKVRSEKCVMCKKVSAYQCFILIYGKGKRGRGRKLYYSMNFLL